MKRLPFVLWALGFPLMCSVVKYLSYLRGFEYEAWGEFITTLIEGAVWVIVAVRIWKDEQ